REFLNSNGAEKHIVITPEAPKDYTRKVDGGFDTLYKELAGDLNVCSKRGLSERFDSTIGAGTVLMPFGGKNQQTPIQAMVQKVSMEKKHTKSCSVMAWGYNPFITEKSPYHGAYLAVIESVSKLIASGASFEDVYLTFQEYFERPNRDGKRWGKPLSALLGSLKAQLDLECASIGGKDSMSGSFENLDVPPTLVSFAVTMDKTDNIITNEFKSAGHKVVLVKPEYDENNLPIAMSLKKVYAAVTKLMREGKAAAAYTPTYGGVAEAVLKMSFGNDIGFKYNDEISLDEIFGYNYGAFVLELTDDTDIGITLGTTTDDKAISYSGKTLAIDELLSIYENKLEPVYSCNITMEKKEIPTFSYSAKSYPSPTIKTAKPRVVIPVFPGTNCEFDTAKVLRDAGAEPEIIVINNLTAKGISESVEYAAKRIKEAQIVFIPGGFSGGDEPDGSGKFITAFFRNAVIKNEVTELLEHRDGLMAGICNGFQALVKLGLVPYGKIIDTDENCPTLTFNTISRHQSRLVRTRIASNKSPWLMETKVGDIYTVPISHGEGRFLANEDVLKKLAENGQIATQYVDLSGTPTNDVRFNPNDSVFAIEGITSPDGRVFGKMGHSERIGEGLYKNVDGAYEMGMFRSAVKYFK
ncbi:MAG: phosphoribosylformylglycinamidine synthase subunit PurQ, partial [Clostridia bacterium]|nr:phosphoribosylformylglycinamidine synthase subunit PurQ [Clostridia bacterium]